MSSQVALLDAGDGERKRKSKSPAKLDEVVGEGFDLAKFVANFETIVEADKGISRLRTLVLEMALVGKLVARSAGTGTKITRLGDVIRLRTGKLDSNAQRPNGAYPFFTCSTVAARVDTCAYDCECVLLSGNGEFHAHYFNGKFDAYQRVYIIESLDRHCLDIKYLHKFFVAYRTALEKLSGGGVIRYIKKEHITEATISLPPLAEQKRIVAKVDELMALIDELEAKQTKKRELGARLTKSALDALTSAEGPDEFDAAWKRVVENFDVIVDRSEKVAEVRLSIFGLACRGMLTRRTSGSGAHLLKEVSTDRRSLAEKQGVGENREVARHIAKLNGQNTEMPSLPIPDRWSWATLLTASSQLVDCHNKTAPYTSSGIALVRTSNVRDGRVNLDGAKYVTAETYERWSRRCPPAPGDVLFTREAPMGEVGLIEDGMTVCMGQRMMLLRVFPNLLDPRYLVLTLRDPAFQARMALAAVGSTVKHLRVGDVEGLFIPVPPVLEQRAIVARVDELMRTCNDLEAKLRRAEARAAKLAEAAVRELVA